VRLIGDVIEPGKTVISSVQDKHKPTPAQERTLVASAAAIALSGPGYGSHIEGALGLGYRLDVAGRIGNGIYALALRRGFDIGNWDASLGVRAGYNSGESVISYFNTINDYVSIAKVSRFDGQVFGQVGREFGEIFKIWAGAKGMWSPYSGEVDASRIGLGTQHFSDQLFYYGGFLGGALGFRYIHLVAELTVLEASGSVRLFGVRHDLSGLTLSPAWGVQGTF